MKYGLKQTTRRSSSAKGRDSRTVCVVPAKKGWVVKKESAKSETSVYATKAEAEKAAKVTIRKQGSGEIRIQGRDGRIRQTFSLSRRDFEKVSAVEGLFLSAELKRDFDELDRRDHSDGQRRKTILKKYAKPRV